MSLMVLGTASHVGKSVTVAAICRCLTLRGIRVAPFKSQNMSLNSYVTVDGGEIGIAQAMQAFAAGIEPSVEMNPILLKPKGDRTSQVVLLGQPYRDVQIGEYYQETEYLLGEAVNALSRLRSRYEHVVVEGAGGAAEVNLFDRDIANILLARKTGLPILLVSDIERGGVFAQVYGTLELLPADIRSRVIGIIINKFRGDPELFEDGIGIIERITGLPVLGVVPHTDLPLPSEDSLSIADKKPRDAAVKIGILRLPRISNFTDFELIEQHASVRYVTDPAQIEECDCIIVPGTKNTVDDLRWLWESGNAEAIIHARERGIPIIGICGGYQMLGRTIADEGIEGGSGRYSGLGLLPVDTRFDAYRKTTVQVKRMAAPVPPLLIRMGEVVGYEIHMGESEIDGTQPAFGKEGAVTADGLVFGTYIHGLFQNPNAAHGLLSYLYEQKGLIFGGGKEDDRSSISTSPYDLLARHFETHVDMDFIASFFEHGEHTA